jgi:hypothetical protein
MIIYILILILLRFKDACMTAHHKILNQLIQEIYIHPIVYLYTLSVLNFLNSFLQLSF